MCRTWNVFFQQPCLALWLTSLADAAAGSAGRHIFFGGCFGFTGLSAYFLFCPGCFFPLVTLPFFFLYFFFLRTMFVDKLSIMETRETAKIFPYFSVLVIVSLGTKCKCAHSLSCCCTRGHFQIKLLSLGPSLAISVTGNVANLNFHDK